MDLVPKVDLSIVRFPDFQMFRFWLPERSALHVALKTLRVWISWLQHLMSFPRQVLSKVRAFHFLKQGHLALRGTPWLPCARTLESSSRM